MDAEIVLANDAGPPERTLDCRSIGPQKGGPTSEEGEKGMIGRRLRRIGVVSAVAVAALALAAPSYAHFCYRTFSGNAAAHAGGSSAWLERSEWLGFLGQLEQAGEICTAGATIMRNAISSAPAGTLFKGPGLLAGGTLRNGKDNGPENVGYLPIAEAMEACGGGEPH